MFADITIVQYNSRVYRKDIAAMKRIIFILILLSISWAEPLSAGSYEPIDPRAITNYLQGVFFESRFDLQAARELYERANRYDRENPTIQLSLAGIYLELGDLGRAERYANDLIKSGFFEYEATRILADIEYGRGNKERALELLLDLGKIGEGPDFEVLKDLSKVYLELGQVDRARDMLEEASRIFGEDLYLQYRLGVLYYETGDVDKAIRAFEKAVEINPGFSNAHHALATLLLSQGRAEEAKRSYLEVLETDPANADALKELSELLMERREYEEGLALLEPLHADQRLDDGGIVMLGRFYYRSGMANEALEIFTSLLGRLDDDRVIRRVISEIEIQRGHFRDAYPYLKELIDVEPDNFANYIGLLLISYGLAGPADGPDQSIDISEQESVELLERAIGTVDSVSAEDNYLVGAVMRRAERVEEAERFLLRAEALRPGDRRTLLELATLYERQKRFDDALDMILQLYDQDPSDATINNYYGYLLAEKGEKLEFAEELLDRALGKEPENGYFLDSLAWIRYKKGEYESARIILIEALERVGDDPVIWEHLGRTYEKLGLREEALEAYEKSLSIEPERDDIAERIRILEEDAE
jgi:tetratricopeptide (TPR) repeat protein